MPLPVCLFLALFPALLPGSTKSTTTVPNPTVLFSTPGPRSIKLRVCDPQNRCSEITRVVTVLDPKPALLFLTIPAIVGSAELGRFTASATGKPPLLYDWIVSPPVAAPPVRLSGPSVTWSPNTLGSHTVVFSLRNGFGTVAPAPAAVTVVPSTFADVPAASPFWTFIETFYASGATGGCGTSPARFCPDNAVTRAEAAIFLAVLRFGPLGTLPPPVGLFVDVPPTHWAARAIEKLANAGITGGCAPGRFCPDSPVTRAQAATLLLAARGGPPPPPAVGIFVDVPVSSPLAKYIEQFANEGITGGCATEPRRFCPELPATRGQLAVFLTATFQLQQRPTPQFQAALCSSAACSYPTGMPIEFKIGVSGGIPQTYEYDWDGNGFIDQVSPIPVTSHVYSTPGTYSPSLTLRRGVSVRSVAHSLPITVAPSTFPAPNPPTVQATIGPLVYPTSTDVPGTFVRRLYHLQTLAPPNSRGVAVYLSRNFGPYNFLALVSPGASTLLTPRSESPTDLSIVQLRVFNSTALGVATSLVLPNDL